MTKKSRPNMTKFREKMEAADFSPEALAYLAVLVDVLDQFSKHKILVDRLTIIGGTALHLFHHSGQPARMTKDIDCSFRGIDTIDNLDLLEELRKKIDSAIKTVFYSLGATPDDIYINPTHALQRIGAHLQGPSQQKIDMKVEISFTRRIPLLGNDRKLRVVLSPQNPIELHVPPTEELIASKICTLISRGLPRDLFDVWFSKSLSFDNVLLRKCLIVESIASLSQPLHSIDIQSTVSPIRYDSGLSNVLPLQSDVAEHFGEMKQIVIMFVTGLIDDLTKLERHSIGVFYETGEFRWDAINKEGLLADEVSIHPLIKWRSQKIRQERE